MVDEICTDAVRARIDEYKQQFQQIEQQLVQLEQQYAQQKQLCINSMNQLVGATTALETLLAEAEKAAADKEAAELQAVQELAKAQTLEVEK